MSETNGENSLRLAAKIFEERIPFNRFLGFRFELLGEDDICIKFDMREEFVGNYMRGNLHGGVISSSLDVIGGLVAFLSLLKKHDTGDFEKDARRFSNLGTIDLRVDYLRPGVGKEFTATGFVLRTGNKVAVTRMELHNDTGILVAVGTGAYSVG